MIVLGTNVISELARQEPDPGVLSWLDSLEAGDVATTAMTAAELRYGGEAPTRSPEAGAGSSDPRHRDRRLPRPGPSL